MLSYKVFKTLTSLQNAELSPVMKCSTISASGIGKQVTSLQQLDKKIPKPQCRARNHISGKQAMTKNATTSSWYGAKTFFYISTSIL